MNEWKRPISVLLSPKDIEQIDELRGSIPRSAFIRNIVKKELEKNVKE